MKWATVFQQVAARPDAIAEIAAQNGITPTEILKQVELQTTCVGSNYELARKAKDALSRRERKASETDEVKKLQKEVRKQLEDETKKALEEQQERERQKREQEQRAQQASPQKTGQQIAPTSPPAGDRRASTPVQQGAGQRTVASAPKVPKPARGCSRTLKLAFGAAVLLGTCLALFWVYKAIGPIIDQGTSGEPGIGPFINQDTGGEPAVPPTCPPLVTERRKCPWTPEGYGVEPCGPGFCWDGGPQGSLACKQEEGVENAGRTYTSDLVCAEGYAAERDPCTNVILRCVKQ